MGEYWLPRYTEATGRSLLTRLQVKGFKNLVDVDVRFGPFTCIAGSNGVGKSNLFDAISFLSSLAEKPLMDAALSVRDESGRTGDVRSLFHRVGNDYDETMSFDMEMLVPGSGIDDLGQTATATSTFLSYSLELRYRSDNGPQSFGRLEIVREELRHIPKKEAPRHLLFKHVPKWRQSVIPKVGRRAAAFISTEDSSIKLHQDGGTGGRQLSYPASTLPRTVLSSLNAGEAPTATLARREMQSWRLLQLEPSRLRHSDSFGAPFQLGADGSHLAATLYHLASSGNGTGRPNELFLNQTEARVYSQVANRLAELIDDVRHVRVDRDDRRELLTVEVIGQDGTPHAARSLSDGTLRFLALAVLELDPAATGLICFEEPENGIHPDRIPAMLELLRNIAVDPEDETGPDNPLRQVIINTHSPGVVGQVADDEVLIASLEELSVAGTRRAPRGLSFRCLSKTWRATAGQPVAPPGLFHPYLSPMQASDHSIGQRFKRIVDREDLQIKFDFPG